MKRDGFALSEHDLVDCQLTIETKAGMAPQLDAAMIPGDHRGTNLDEPKQDYIDYRAKEDEECHAVDNGTRTMEEDSEGYISTKDYAYDLSDPLHYGYLQDTGKGLTDEANYDTDEDADDEGVNGDFNKRQSIVLPQDYLINQLAVALYDFEPENDNELGLTEGDIVYISYRHGQGWLVAENQEGTKTGLVPEEFVSYLEDSDGAADEDGEDGEEIEGETVEAARPFYLTHYITQGLNPGSRKQDEEAEGSEDIRGEKIQFRIVMISRRILMNGKTSIT